MTINELRDILSTHCNNNYGGAQIYVEIQLADDVYIQKPVEHIRIENTTYSNICIIAGVNNDNQN